MNGLLYPDRLRNNITIYFSQFRHLDLKVSCLPVLFDVTLKKKKFPFQPTKYLNPIRERANTHRDRFRHL